MGVRGVRWGGGGGGLPEQTDLHACRRMDDHALVERRVHTYSQLTRTYLCSVFVAASLA